MNPCGGIRCESPAVRVEVASWLFLGLPVQFKPVRSSGGLVFNCFDEASEPVFVLVLFLERHKPPPSMVRGLGCLVKGAPWGFRPVFKACCAGFFKGSEA